MKTCKFDVSFTKEKIVPCGMRLTQKQYEYSMKKFGAPICWGHQKRKEVNK